MSKKAAQISSLCYAHEDSVNALSLSSSGKLLASGGDDACLCVWAAHDRLLINKVHFSGEIVTALSFSRENKLYAAHGSQLVAWDVRDLREPVSRICILQEEINCLALHSTEHWLAVAADDGVHIVDTQKDDLVRSLSEHENICSSVLFRADRADQIISGGLDCHLIVADWKSSDQSSSVINMSDLLLDEKDNEEENLDVHCAPISINPPMVHCLASISDLNGTYRVACGLENGTVELFDVGSEEDLVYQESLCGHSKAVSALLALASVGKCLISGGVDETLLVWQLEGDPEPRRYAYHSKINQFEGSGLEEVYIADCSKNVTVCNLLL